MSEKIKSLLIALVKRYEGLSLVAYQDCVGVWTIGWGHTGKVNGKPIQKEMTITQAEAEKLLEADLAAAWSAVQSCPQFGALNDCQKAALCSFEFNLGKLWQICYIWQNGSKARARTVAEIEKAIPLYSNAGGKFNQGLHERRIAEQKLFSGVKPQATSTANLPTISSGNKGDAVRALQLLLGGLAVDGVFGQKTQDAVQKFQSSHGLAVDGIVGQKTWAKIINEREHK